MLEKVGSPKITKKYKKGLFHVDWASAFLREHHKESHY